MRLVRRRTGGRASSRTTLGRCLQAVHVDLPECRPRFGCDPDRTPENRRGVGQDRSQISEEMESLFLNKVCQSTAAGAIQITELCGPYERDPASQQAETPATYVSQIKRLFLARRCVRSAFAAA